MVITSGLGSFQGRFGDHFGLGIILGAVQISHWRGQELFFQFLLPV